MPAWDSLPLSAIHLPGGLGVDGRWLPVLIAAYFIGSIIWSWSRRPKFPPQASVKIVFRERFASGGSLKNWITRLGGASRCLTVVVTGDELWIRSFFPFTLYSGIHHIEQRIRLMDLLEVSPWKSGLRLRFRNASGETAAFWLRLRDRRRFLDCLSGKVGSGVLPQAAAPAAFH